MTKRIIHNPFSGQCEFFYLRFLIYFVFLFFLCIPVISGFSAEQPETGDASSKSSGESVYIIPDQPNSPLKFGVAITPYYTTDHNPNHTLNQYFRYMEIPSHSRCLDPFENDHKRTKHAKVSSVVRVAIDEFKFFSGLSHRINYVEKSMSGYSRKLMLTGELNLDSRNADPIDYMENINLVAEISINENPMSFRRSKIKSIPSQFEINKLTWGMGLYVNRQAISFKLGLGDAIIIQSFVGQDVRNLIKFKLSI